MLMSFDIKFIRGDQKQRRNGLPSLCDVFLVEPDKLDIKRQLHGFYHILLADLMAKRQQNK